MSFSYCLIRKSSLTDKQKNGFCHDCQTSEMELFVETVNNVKYFFQKHCLLRDRFFKYLRDLWVEIILPFEVSVFILLKSFLIKYFFAIKVKVSWCIVLFEVSGSIEKLLKAFPNWLCQYLLFSINNYYFLNSFFNSLTLTQPYN